MTSNGMEQNYSFSCFKTKNTGILYFSWPSQPGKKKIDWWSFTQFGLLPDGGRWFADRLSLDICPIRPAGLPLSSSWILRLITSPLFVLLMFHPTPSFETIGWLPSFGRPCFVGRHLLYQNLDSQRRLGRSADTVRVEFPIQILRNLEILSNGLKTGPACDPCPTMPRCTTITPTSKKMTGTGIRLSITTDKQSSKSAIEILLSYSGWAVESI